jgi:hypothetical protein
MKRLLHVFRVPVVHHQYYFTGRADYTVLLVKKESSFCCDSTVPLVPVPVEDPPKNTRLEKTYIALIHSFTFYSLFSSQTSLSLSLL